MHVSAGSHGIHVDGHCTRIKGWTSPACVRGQGCGVRGHDGDARDTPATRAKI